MKADTLLYAPTGSGLRVRLLESPSRHGDSLMCAAVFEGGPHRAPERMAARLAPMISAPPFKIQATRIHHSTIFAPWPQKEAMHAALHSLLATPSEDSGETALKSQIDRNTLASLVGHGGGLLHHLQLRTRRWRFSDFVLIEEFQLLSMKWTVTAEDDTLPASAQRPTVVLRGGLNTPAERRSMAVRLVRASMSNWGRS